MNHGRYCITSYLQLSRVGLVWPRPHRPALILLFAKKFFRACDTAFPGCARGMFTGRMPVPRRARMRWNGQIFWLLAFEDVESLWLRNESQSQAFPPLSTLNTQLSTAFTFFSPSPPKAFGDWPSGKLYPVTAAQLLPIRTGFLAPVHFFQARKELDRGVAACALSFKIYLSIRN